MREEVVRAWTERVLADPVVPEANRLPEPLLRDDVPTIFDHIVDAIATNDRVSETDGRTIGHGPAPRAHASQRLRAGYSAAAALRELSHFRVVLIEAFGESGERVQGDVAAVVHVAIDEAMSQAAALIDDAANGRVVREERRLRNVLELLPVGVFVVDAEGAITETNDAARRIWGITPKVGSAKEYGAYEAYSTTTGERLEAEEWALARTLRGEVVEPQELEIVTATGERRIILNSAAPLRDDTGRIVGGVAVNVDITDRKSAEAALMNAKESLELDAVFRERFIGVLGHDLRTPLSAISLGASALVRHELPIGEARIAQRIATSAARMDRMIRDLLDVVRATQGGIPIERKPAHLDDVVRTVIDEIELAYPDRVIELKSHGGCDGQFDTDRMAQAVTNLVTNALDYSPPDTRVRVDVGGTEGTVRLRVNNVGTQIPPSAIATLFHPFTRGAAHVAEKRKGLGLGLYIVNEIVRAHGGTIVVASDAENGTTFEVLLPRAA